MMIVNRSLPEDIRVLGWTDVPPTFSSRFSCTGRTYRYFFPARNLNIAVRCGAVRCGAVRCGAVRCGAVRCGAVRCDAVRCGAVPSRCVPVDPQNMQAAAASLVGRHDFRNFCKMNIMAVNSFVRYAIVFRTRTRTRT